MTGGPHDETECAGCEWERQPQAFRWFPELGRPLEPARAGRRAEG